jgi:hypothetical protein
MSTTAYTEITKTSTPTAPGFGASSAERCRGVNITLWREMLQQAQHRLVVNPSASSGPDASADCRQSDEKKVAEEWLTGIGVELNPEKTYITHTLEPYDGRVGFDFGWNIRLGLSRATVSGG